MFRWMSFVVALMMFPSASAQQMPWKPIKGYFDAQQTSCYGTQGVVWAGNRIGARFGAASWTGADGKIYIFGGEHYDGQTALRFNDLWQFDPATGALTWLKGSQSANQPGSYGGQNVPAAGNTPGAREEAVAWTGADGKLYLFGGDGYDSVGNRGKLNDLWRFDPSSKTWTWLKGNKTVDVSGIYGTKGTAASGNNPGSRSGAAAWIGPDGKLWLFGGFGRDEASGKNGNLNDQWKYDPPANRWTWVKGSKASGQAGSYGTQAEPSSSNMPGARSGAAYCAGTEGKFYMFGGYGVDAAGKTGCLNDAWAFEPATGQWAWYKGSKNCDQAGVYGTKGTAAEANTPGARKAASAWVAADGNIYIFGGYYNYAGSSSQGELNDLWRMDTETGQWTWMKGSKTANQPGVYGTQGVASSSNTPGAREAAVAVAGRDGNLYLLGGYQYANSEYENYNDLWKYSPGGNWTWQAGSNLGAGVYGAQGVSASANTPGARSGPAVWTANDGKVYLFGGYGSAESGVHMLLSDLWRYDPSSGRWTWLKGSKSGNQLGVYGTTGTPSSSNNPGGRFNAAAWLGADGKLYLFGGTGCDSAGYQDFLADLWRYDPSSGNWTYLKGTKSGTKTGVYGTIGTAASANMPGSRRLPAAWTAADGKLYMFGGDGYDEAGLYDSSSNYNGFLSDLWRYDPASGNWAWVGGSKRGGQVGVYGNPGVAGSSYHPGARCAAAVWIGPDRKFYLFGGYGHHEFTAGSTKYLVWGNHNDVWRFDPATGLWAFLKGSTQVNVEGFYGTKGVADVTNRPGGRMNSAAWTGADGKLYLFGGMDKDSSGDEVRTNDLWRYDIAANTWTWMTGVATADESGNYIGMGVASTSNNPGARNGAGAWVANGKLFMFGGLGRDCSGTLTDLGDLWSADLPRNAAREWVDYE